MLACTGPPACIKKFASGPGSYQHTKTHHHRDVGGRDERLIATRPYGGPSSSLGRAPLSVASYRFYRASLMKVSFGILIAIIIMSLSDMCDVLRLADCS